MGGIAPCPGGFVAVALADPRPVPTPRRRCDGCRALLAPRQKRWCSDRCRVRVRTQTSRLSRPMRSIVHAPACQQCGGPIPATRSTVPRQYCSNRCRGFAYRLAHPDESRAHGARYRAKLKATGRTPWWRAHASAYFDELARGEGGIPQRSLRCEQCRAELAALVTQPDGKRFLLVGGQGRVVVALDPNGRDGLRVECPRCQVFRAVAARRALVPGAAADQPAPTRRLAAVGGS